MLSPREQRSWDDIVRAERWEPLPAVVVGGGWGAVLLLVFGVPMAALAVAAATALVWVVWRFLPQQTSAAADQEAGSRTAG